MVPQFMTSNRKWCATEA